MLYTRKGDSGTTKTFGCDQRISKSSAIAEALGSMDEINSLLGVCKVLAAEVGAAHEGRSLASVVGEVQHNLFIIQAELAGADKRIMPEKVAQVEAIVDSIEKVLPPIKSFFVSGGSKLGAQFDYARAVSRRAERRVVRAKEEGNIALADATLAYLNRLSSLLYALARLANHLSGITEEPPTYR